MATISEQWAYLLDPGIREIFALQTDVLTAESKIPMLFRQETSSKAVEYFLSRGGMGSWSEYKGVIEYDDMEQGYRTGFTHKEYAKGFTIERKLVDDDQYAEINSRPRELAISAAVTRESHAAGVFIYSFTDSSAYHGGDGEPLCANAHPMSPGNTGTTQDNQGSSALTYDNIVTTRRLMREFKDDRGKRVSSRPDTLLVPLEKEEAAFAIYRSLQKVDSGDSHANFVQAVLSNVIVWDELTDANDWWLIDMTKAKIHLLWLDRVPLELAMDPTGDFRLEARWRGYMRYSYGWSDWRWVYGHSASA